MTQALRDPTRKYQQVVAAVVESANLDHQDHLAQMEKMVLTVNRELQATQAKTHHSLRRPHLQNSSGASNVSRPSPDLLAIQDPGAPLANPEPQDLLEAMELLVQEDLRDHRDLQDHQDQLAREDLMDPQANPPKQRDPLARLDLPVPLDLPDLTDLLGHQAHQEQTDHLGQKENQGQTDHQANRDPMARRVRMERLAWLVLATTALLHVRLPDIKEEFRS